MEALMGPDRHRCTSVSHKDQLNNAAMAFLCLCAEQAEGDSPRRTRVPPQLDPYVRASVARSRLPATVGYLQAEPAVQSNILEDPRVVRKPMMKRKVLRRRPDGEVQVTDESIITETESSSPSEPKYTDLSQRMYTLNTQHKVKEPQEEREPNSCPGSEVSYSLSATEESQSQGFERESRNCSTAPYRQDLMFAGHPKSFILPRSEHLSRNQMKTDRVARYLEYKHDWELLRLPGEDPRKGVRLSIREQMLCKSEFPARPQHIYIPNNYLVPTEKKRSALRWGIRCDLANGIMPRNSYS